MVPNLGQEQSLSESACCCGFDCNFVAFFVFIFQAPQSRKRLRCYYKTDHPLCTIKRCPIEVVFTNPDIMILHQIMSSAEIDRVIKIAEPLVRELVCTMPIYPRSYVCPVLKGGVYFCYCAYVLRISRYSGFLWAVHTNTGIFLRGLKQCGESRT